jgi:hypothetical protein
VCAHGLVCRGGFSIYVVHLRAPVVWSVVMVSVFTLFICVCPWSGLSWWFQYLCCSSVCAQGLVCRGSFSIYVVHLHVSVVWSVVVVSVFMLFICVCPWSDLSWWFHCTLKPPRQTRPLAHTDGQHKHYMNQMVVHKKTA